MNVQIPTSATNDVVEPTLVITASPFNTSSLAPPTLTFSSTSKPCASTVLIVASPTTLSYTTSYTFKVLPVRITLPVPESVTPIPVIELRETVLAEETLTSLSLPTPTDVIL